MSARQSWPKRVLLTVSAAMLALWSSLLIPGYALGAAGAPNPGAGGNNGTVKICDVANGCPSSNDPHLSCPITIQWTGFDVAPAPPAPQDTFKVVFSGISPTNGTVSANGAGDTDNGSFGGPDFSKQYSLQISNGTPNNKGEYHIGIDITTTTANGSDFKQKTVWVGNCAVVNPTGTVTATGACNAASGNYEWTFSTTPATSGVSGTYSPSGGGPGTYTTGAGGSTTTTLSSGHVNTISYTVTSPAGFAPAAGGSPASATLDPNCAAPGALTLSAACSSANSGQVTWTVTNPSTNPPVNSLVVSNAAALSATSLAPGASATFTTLAPQSTALTVTGKAPGNANVSSNSQDFAGSTCTTPGNPEVPASVAFSSTCTGIHVVFTTASQHTTTFTVTAPHNTSDSVSGSGTRDYNADKNDSHINVAYDGTSQGFDWVDPGNCSTPPPPPPPGQAQPDASATNACTTGITVVLSNMNGTAPATFTVTGPDGTTTTVPVNAGQLKKLSFVVAEDTTGVVTVSAPGLAKTFTYAKNCTKVLGEKHTVKPPKTPTKVLGEHSQLPFTGFNAKSAIFDAATLLALGAIVCALAMPRRRRFTPYTEV